jgi:hypothetical protein
MVEETQLDVLLRWLVWFPLPSLQPLTVDPAVLAWKQCPLLMHHWHEDQTRSFLDPSHVVLDAVLRQSCEFWT